ncbi:Uncharacterized protein SCF082_LOCUS16815 [Durusdinium trenchii]|uniref:Uncharacterized protein n=1 Tax=Durusdinium trenchii TaxID=1381693 RepID=A0ABP0KDJ9_9DINO
MKAAVLLSWILFVNNQAQASFLRQVTDASAQVGRILDGTTWTCHNVTTVTGKLLDHDSNGKPSVGDCIQYPASVRSSIDLTQGTSSQGKIPGTDQFASFVTNATCGGLTITEFLPSSPSSSGTSTSSLEPPSGFSCPKGQIAVRSGAGSDDSNVASRITTTTGRGVGVPVSSCDKYGADWDEDAGLCYPPCRSGFTGAGPLCLVQCPSGFKDTGLECEKPSSYGRGAGHIGHCNNCEKYGLLYYPRCAENFHNVGCCVCSPDCPSNTKDIGVACQKNSYPRGVGKPLGCPDGFDYDAGLCYHKCPPGAHGVGPLCYGECTADQPYRLGIWCYASESERNEILGAIIGGVIGGAILVGVVTAVAAPLIVAAVSAAAVAGPVVIASSGPLTSSIVIVGALAL